jgi:hypothetical protein
MTMSLSLTNTVIGGNSTIHAKRQGTLGNYIGWLSGGVAFSYLFLVNRGSVAGPGSSPRRGYLPSSLYWCQEWDVKKLCTREEKGYIFATKKEQMALSLWWYPKKAHLYLF